jgi:hypothetical protein
MFFSKKHLFSLSAILVIVILFYSCEKEKDPLKKYGPFVEKVIQTEDGAFRGFNFGEKMDTIIAKEASQAAETDEGYLYYEYKIGALGSFSITYDFNEAGLNEIQSDVFITNSLQSDSVFNSFRKYFDDHFGKNELDMGYNVWSVKSEKYGNIKINLSDESADFTDKKAPGKIAIWIYPDKD